jgi:hypothetical protein
MVDDFKDSYNAAKAWWNSDGNKYNHPAEHLMEKLQDRGKGHVFYSNESPAALTRRVDGDQLVAKLAREALAAAGHGADWREQSQLVLRRGSYVVAAVVDESVSNMPVTIKGTMVNLFDPELTVRRDPALPVGSVAFYGDLAKVKNPGVVASSSRIRNEVAGASSLLFTSRGASGTEAVTRILLPRNPQAVSVSNAVEAIPATTSWDESSKTLLLRHANLAKELRVACRW